MVVIMKYFDFIYYRLTLMFSPIKNSHNAAIGLVSLMQFALLFYPFMSVAAWSIRFREGFIVPMNSVYFIGMGVLVCLFIVNNIRYETHMPRRLSKIESLHMNMSKNSLRIFDILIIVFVFIVIFYAPIFLLLTGATLRQASL